MGLFVVLLISGKVILLSVNWIYQRIHTRLGIEIAGVVVAFLMILIVILMLFGFGAGLGADQILRRKKVRALWIYRTLKRYRIMRSLWRYIKPNEKMESAGPPAIETISIPECPPRRGRRPTYSFDRWVRVVQAWESRDLQRNTMTLSEYLVEQFGMYADGSPRMSENSYYEWRRRVLNELRKQKTTNKEQSAA
jgi:hypothetical protein